MPCTPIINPDGSFGGVICSLGPYTHLVEAHCPWCCVGDDPPRVCAFREVYGGYEAPDLVCGSCGQAFNPEPDYPLRKMTEDQRQKGIALVSEMAKRMQVGPWPRPSALEEPPL